MLALAPGTQVFLASQPVDMRKGFDGLAAFAQQVLDLDPFGGQLFLFRSKRADYLKALYWDGSGLCLFAKRLEKGKFVWPPLANGYQILTPAQLATLIEGMDWRRTIAPSKPKTPKLLRQQVGDMIAAPP
jgi:transposase